nr:MAG: zer-1-like protein [Metapenaeus ensis nimavirus]
MESYEWEGDSPKSLKHLCIRKLVLNKEIFCNKNFFYWHLKDGIVLPNIISEMILEALLEEPTSMGDDIINIFRNTERTNLKRVDLRQSTMTNEGLKTVLEHRLSMLAIGGNQYYLSRTLFHINEYGDSLKSLCLEEGLGKMLIGIYKHNHQRCWYNEKCPLGTPNLEKLIVRLDSNVKFMPHITGTICIRLLILPLKKLTHLDISNAVLGNCHHYTLAQTNLTVLKLHDAYRVTTLIRSIMCIKTLKVLDISRSMRREGMFMAPIETFFELLTRLSSLESLDLSGTNLAEGIDRCDLRPCKNLPLSFIGLYDTDGACSKSNIPALKYSGDADEIQLLTALTAFMEYPLMLCKVLMNLHKLLITQKTSSNLNLTISLIEKAIISTPGNRDVHLRGRYESCASAIYIYTQRRLGDVIRYIYR